MYLIVKWVTTASVVVFTLRNVGCWYSHCSHCCLNRFVGRLLLKPRMFPSLWKALCCFCHYLSSFVTSIWYTVYMWHLTWQNLALCTCCRSVLLFFTLEVHCEQYIGTVGLTVTHADYILIWIMLGCSTLRPCLKPNTLLYFFIFF